MTQDQKDRIFLYQVNRKSKYVTGKTGWVCPIWWTEKKQMLPVTESHHRLSNTKMNRKLYPLVVHSMLSRVPVEGGIHKMRASFGNINHRRAAMMQAFLQRHPPMSDFVNGKVEHLWT